MVRFIAAILFALTCVSAQAAELKVFITNGAKPVMSEVAAQFEKGTGHKLSITYQGSAVLQEAIIRGDAFDTALLISSNMDAVNKDGRVRRDKPNQHRTFRPWRRCACRPA